MYTEPQQKLPSSVNYSDLKKYNSTSPYDFQNFEETQTVKIEPRLLAKDYEDDHYRQLLYSQDFEKNILLV